MCVWEREPDGERKKIERLVSARLKNCSPTDAPSAVTSGPSPLSVRHFFRSVTSPSPPPRPDSGPERSRKQMQERERSCTSERTISGMSGLIFHNAFSDKHTKTTRTKTHLRTPSLQARPTTGVLILELRDDCALPSRCDPLLPNFSLSRSSALLMSCVCVGVGVLTTQTSETIRGTQVTQITCTCHCALPGSGVTMSSMLWNSHQHQLQNIPSQQYNEENKKNINRRNSCNKNKNFTIICNCIRQIKKTSVWVPLRECRLIRPGASGLPYYCAPLVCVSAVLELLTVWLHNKPKTKNKNKKSKRDIQVGEAAGTYKHVYIYIYAYICIYWHY